MTVAGALEPSGRFGRAGRFVIGGAAILCLAFQQSPANEAVRTAIALDFLKRTDNPFIVGLVVAVLTMVIEGGTSLMIALGLHLKGSSVNQLLRRVKRDKNETSGGRESKTSKVADYGITLSIGAGIVVIKRHVQDPQRTRMMDVQTGLAFSLFGSIVSGLIGFLAAGGIKYAEQVGLGTPARYVVDYATDWRFWAVIVGSVYGAQGLASLLRRVKLGRRTPNQAVEEAGSVGSS